MINVRNKIDKIIFSVKSRARTTSKMTTMFYHCVRALWGFGFVVIHVFIGTVYGKAIIIITG